MATTILTTCNNSIEASLIKGMLENNGIHSFLTNENFSGLMPNCNGIMGAGVQIVIDDFDLDAATKLISSQETTNKIICPNCQSSNTRFGLGTNKIKKVFTVIFSLIFWIPFGNVKNTYYCQDCKTEFK
jgi:hypothetical protein